MPVYVYECKNCGSRFDKMQSFSAAPLTECENCGQGPLRRVFQPVGVIFKGSGWYITDSRKSDSAASAGKTPSTDAAEAKSDKTADAKPAESNATAASTPAKATTSDAAPAD